MLQWQVSLGGVSSVSRILDLITLCSLLQRDSATVTSWTEYGTLLRTKSKLAPPHVGSRISCSKEHENH